MRNVPISRSDLLRIGAFGFVFLPIDPAIAYAADPQKPDSQEFLRHTFSPSSGVQAAAGAAIGQARDVPKEWGGGIGGFAKRLGSGFGTHVVNGSIHFAVASLRHEEWGYRPSGKEGFGPRLKYALLSTVITRKTTDGKQTVAAGELSGAFGSGLISRLWQPASTGTIAKGFASGGIAMAADAGTHVVREFWPEIRHPRRRAQLRSAPLNPNADAHGGTVAAVAPRTAQTQ
jgi:hypothetical protein